MRISDWSSRVLFRSPHDRAPDGASARRHPLEDTHRDSIGSLRQAAGKREGLPAAFGRLELQLAGAFQLQSSTGLVGRSHFQIQRFNDGTYLADLLSVRRRQLARADPEGILETHTYVRTHGRTHGGQRDLIAPCPQDGPLIVIAKQAVGRTAHMHQVFRIGAYAAQDAKYRL